MTQPMGWSEGTIEVTHDRPWRERLALALICVLILVVGGLASVEIARLNQARSNREVLNIIKDSVDPGGVRFQRGQAATSAAISTINDTTQIAVYCGNTFRDLTDIQACVVAEFSKLHPPVSTP